jgi:hypothetical protein
MGRAAHISYAELISLMDRMPSYNTYLTREEAESAEKDFRQALGHMLKECGEQLLNLAEKQRPCLAEEQEIVIDVLVERISAIFRRLDREGVVCLVGDCESTIAELEELDTRLILLIEETIALVRTLQGDVRSLGGFKEVATLLSRDLAAFSEAAEERNFLLGLGWESEFAWYGRNV